MAILAASTSQILFGVLGSLLVGGAVFLVVRWVIVTLESGDLEQGDEWRFDVTRINELRRQDMLFRFFQPLFHLFARFNRNAFPGALPEIEREIQAAGVLRFWLPEEYLARCQIIALLMAPLYLYICLRIMEFPGVVMAVVLTGLTAWVLRRQLAVRARRRLSEIKKRMPYLLDLLTLLMEAGSTFIRALDEAASEFLGHPVAVEFRRVLTDINMGKTRTEAFQAMRDRLRDDDITSIIGAIIQGESLGTPLAQIFRTQADVLRIKRSQRAETVAGEAGVNMLLPGVLVMLSSVLIILGPFLLNYFNFGWGI
jgi:tight adherence protein C